MGSTWANAALPPHRQVHLRSASRELYCVRLTSCEAGEVCGTKSQDQPNFGYQYFHRPWPETSTKGAQSELHIIRSVLREDGE